MTAFLPWLQLIGAAAAILYASTYLVKSADSISLKTGLDRSFVGVLLLATATSLPELGTGINAVASLGAVDLAAGDVFGSNIFNLLIITVLDVYWRGQSFLGIIPKSVWFIAVLSILLIFVAAIGLLKISFLGISIGHIGLLSYLIFALFLVVMFMIFRQSKTNNNDTSDVTISETENPLIKQSLRRNFLIYGLSAVVVIISGVFLSIAGKEIAELMKWGESFVGTQLLALSTSLPELATSIAAVRMRTPDLAISNLLGSNLFNTGFVLFIDDGVYFNGSIWNDISNAHFVSAMVAIFMTLIVLVTVFMRPKRKMLKVVGIESVLLVICYIFVSIYIFQNPH